MNAKLEKENAALDSVKWIVALSIVAAGVVGNYYFSAESLLYRVIALLVLAVVAGWVALQTTKGKQFSALVSEAKTEIRKVVWPTRPELIQTTFMVVVFVLVVALVLWGVDSLIGWVISSVIG
ncbi:preprotein translocase subunit SecE [Oleiphilus sp. HI0009]|uniref:preprotein translocase subunit SecE n=3 Tax=Oleiphilus TaxID=141450 RepID=UPI0007C26FEE|nr:MULTISPECIES: preprotein translocase subunit SecE [unclassified Oleiphilus]KZX86412.1 preprotein translocase subunit SecE [Oleiphilus sp. HI0009]KZY70109.1 preprotein translocase subunit SecE [Oleiphilus sp. HI0066]KZZ60929.1 preprotein translocase subunit SecE [Oleiphilus sp. HI0125]